MERSREKRRKPLRALRGAMGPVTLSYPYVVAHYPLPSHALKDGEGAPLKMMCGLLWRHGLLAYLEQGTLTSLHQGEPPVCGDPTCHVPQNPRRFLHAELDLIQIVHDLLHLLRLPMKCFRSFCAHLVTSQRITYQGSPSSTCRCAGLLIGPTKAIASYKMWSQS